MEPAPIDFLPSPTRGAARAEPRREEAHHALATARAEAGARANAASRAESREQAAAPGDRAADAPREIDFLPTGAGTLAHGPGPDRLGLLTMNPGVSRLGTALAPMSAATAAELDAAIGRGLKPSSIKSYRTILGGYGAFLLREGVAVTGTAQDISYTAIARYGAWFVLRAPNLRIKDAEGHNPESFATLRSVLKSWVRLELGQPWPLTEPQELRLNALGDALAALRPAKSYARVAVRAHHLGRAFDRARGRVAPRLFQVASTLFAVHHHALLRVSESTDGWLRARDVKFTLEEGRPVEAELTLRRTKTGDPSDPRTGGLQVARLGRAQPGWPDALGMLYDLFVADGLFEEANRGRAVFVRGEGAAARPWTPAEVNAELKAWLEVDESNAGQLGRMSAHSLRKGGATDWRAAGVSIERLKTLGRWRSDAWMAYVLLEEDVMLAVADDIEAAGGSNPRARPRKRPRERVGAAAPEGGGARASRGPTGPGGAGRRPLPATAGRGAAAAPPATGAAEGSASRSGRARRLPFWMKGAEG